MNDVTQQFSAFYQPLPLRHTLIPYYLRYTTSLYDVIDEWPLFLLPFLNYFSMSFKQITVNTVVGKRNPGIRGVGQLFKLCNTLVFTIVLLHSILAHFNLSVSLTIFNKLIK